LPPPSLAENITEEAFLWRLQMLYISIAYELVQSSLTKEHIGEGGLLDVRNRFFDACSLTSESGSVKLTSNAKKPPSLTFLSHLISRLSSWEAARRFLRITQEKDAMNHTLHQSMFGSRFPDERAQASRELGLPKITTGIGLTLLFS